MRAQLATQNPRSCSRRANGVEPVTGYSLAELQAGGLSQNDERPIWEATLGRSERRYWHLT